MLAETAVVEDQAERVEVGGNHRSAGRHGLHQHDAEALAAALRGDVGVRGLQRGRLGLLGNPAGEAQHVGVLAGAVHRLGSVAVADDQDLQLREHTADGGHGVEQHGQALAGLVETAEEHQPLETGRGRTDLRHVGGVGCCGILRDAHAVGDEHRVAAELLDLPAPRHLRHGDAAADALQHRPQQGRGQLQRQRLRRRRVVRGHDGAHRGAHGEHGVARRIRLVDVQHVEVAVGDPAPDLPRRHGAERQPRHRPVVRDRDRAPAALDEFGYLGGRAGRTDQADLVAARPELLAQVDRVRLHAAGHVEGIRADHSDAHVRTPPLRVLCDAAVLPCPPSTTAAACASPRGGRRCRTP